MVTVVTIRNKNEEQPDEKGQKWPQYVAALTATLAAFTIGIHGGWPAPSLPKILSLNHYNHPVTTDEASYITTIAMAGDIIGGFLVSFLMNRIGRKQTMLVMALPQILSFLLIYFSYNGKSYLYAARIIGGVAEGGVLTILPLYIGEIAEPNIRGALGTIFSTCVMFGFLVANAIGSFVTIHTAALIYLIFPVLFLMTFSFMPETPYYLIMKGRANDAAQSLKTLRRKTNVDDELMILTKDVNRQMIETTNYKDLFRIKSNRRAFLIAFGARSFQQLTGFAPFMFYGQIFFAEATQSLDPHYGSMLVQFVECLITGVAMFVVDRIGRRTLGVYSSVGCFLVLTLQAIFFTLKTYGSYDLTSVSWVPLVLMVVFIVVYSLGLGVVVTIITSEIFSTGVKAKAMGFVNVSFAVTVFFATKFYQVLADSYGLAVPFYCFAVFTFCSIGFFRVYVPETRGKSLEEIQQELRK